MTYNGYKNWETWEFYNYYSGLLEDMANHARSIDDLKEQISELIEETKPQVSDFWKSVVNESINLIDVDDLADTVYEEDDDDE